MCGVSCLSYQGEWFIQLHCFDPSDSLNGYTQSYDSRSATTYWIIAFNVHSRSLNIRHPDLGASLCIKRKKPLALLGTPAPYKRREENILSGSLYILSVINEKSVLARSKIFSWRLRSKRCKMLRLHLCLQEKSFPAENALHHNLTAFLFFPHKILSFSRHYISTSLQPS